MKGKHRKKQTTHTNGIKRVVYEWAKVCKHKLAIQHIRKLNLTTVRKQTVRRFHYLHPVVTPGNQQYALWVRGCLLFMLFYL